MGWNYRIGTQLHKLADCSAHKDERTFSIVEVYYDEITGFPDAWGASSVANWWDLNSLITTHKLMRGAFDKPILDLDNLPNEYKQEESCQIQ